IKDAQSCGAAIQNMMLAAHSLGIGSCWIGEILPKDDEIKAILNIENSDLELMAVVTFGYSAGQPSSYIRNSLESFLL
ncbi:MAG: nitroreductase family protein, partial [Clostridiales bacterium]|nr:nitroreductase family protein [Clostridiales bacterium]